jgi:PTS system nitrogen regulatory IIA component
MPQEPYTADQYRDLPEVLTAEQVARILGISVEHVRRWAADGTIPARKLGKSWRFSKSRIEAYVQGEDS